MPVVAAKGASPAPETPRTPAAEVRKWVEDNDAVFEPYREAISREERFLDGERYVRDSGPEQRDRRLTQIRGQEIQDTIRDFSAEATAKPRSVEARPVDMDSDPDIAEVEVALIDQELKNPWKGFETRYYEAVLDSRERRMGIVWADWDPDCGAYGEILYRSVDVRRCMWTPGYDPHHPSCDVFLEKRRCPVRWIHDAYPSTKAWLKEDQASLDETGRKLRPGVPLIMGSDGHSMLPSGQTRDGCAELWFCWYKNDRKYVKRETGNELALKPEDRYLSCANGCGYRSPTQGELQQDVGGTGEPKLTGDLPAELDGCPTCADQGVQGTLKRIDRRAEEEMVKAYARGKRLVIIAPFQHAPDDDAVYDGPWPLTRCRSYPGLFLWANLSPRKPMGKSDVTLMWDQQVASDNLATIALQRVFEHRNYWIMPAVGINDYRGGRFEFREDQFNTMYRDMTKSEFGSLQVEAVNGTGLDPGWQIAYGAVQEKLTRYRGIVDLGLTEDNTKNIAVGTVQQLTKQGKIPVEEYNRRKNQELSKFYGVLSDMIHATYTPQRLTRLNLEGIDLVVGMWGEDMPNFDFVVEETPEFTGLEKQKNEAFSAMVQVIPLAAQLGIPPDALLDIFAEVNGLPRSVVRKFQKAMAAAKQEAEQAQQAQQMAGMGAGGMQGAAPGMGSDGAAPPDPMAALMSGLNGGGMVPQPAG